jgi:membrane protease YdiL (CAAX protease family)
VSTLESPERPAGLPPRRPGADRSWNAVWALPIALAAVVASGIAYATAGAMRDALTTAPVHRDGIVGVALHGAPPLLTLIGTLVQDLALVAGAVLAAAAGLKGRIGAAHFGLRPTRLASAAGLVAAGYALFLVLSVTWTSGLGITDHENVAIELGTRDSALALAGAGFLVCVVAPICEELFFRGFLFGGLRRHGLVVSTLVTGLAFGLAHVASAPIGFIVPLAALGVILCLLYERTGSLYPSMALHALNNAIAFGVGDGRAWLIPICLAVAAAVMYTLSRAVAGGQPWRPAARTI